MASSTSGDDDTTHLYAEHDLVPAAHSVSSVNLRNHVDLADDPASGTVYGDGGRVGGRVPRVSSQLMAFERHGVAVEPKVEYQSVTSGGG